ncbi:unnamed protein product [Polarella glacialis]|uniref:AB hydrolase-1 domain-containing protein n=1 Tax=Polarella glacialis TaxID=89957 RepID=A0A813HJP1_POLGL|nr:unnamed protein product [Polarella glacialis]
MDDNMLSEVGGSTRQSSASNSGHTEHEPMADEALLTLCAAGLGDPMKTSSVADLAAELGQTAAGRIRELQKRTLDLLEARVAEAFPAGRVSTYCLAKVLKKLTWVAAMNVIPLKTLEDAWDGGTMPSLNCTDSTIDVTETPEKSRVLLVSHRWWSSVRAEPDQVSAGWPKVKAILTKMIPAFMESSKCTKDDIYIWWDFVSICQVDGPLKQSQIACIPIFVAMSDAVVACRAGDEDYHADGGPLVYDRSQKANVQYTGNISLHPGHYDNRVWTMCELFISTSNFQRQIRGEEMPVYTVGLDANNDIVSGPKDQTKKLRSEFHEMHGWSMPPRENLISKRDLKMLEPLIVMLAGESMPRIVRAGKFGLCIALEELLAAGDNANASDPSNGETALHAVARGQHEAMIERLLSCPGIAVNIQNEAGQAPLHLLVASGMFDPRHLPEKQKRCIELLLNAGAGMLLEDNRGRTSVDAAVARHGQLWANHLFPDSQEMVRRSSFAPDLVMRSPCFEEAGHIFKATRRFESGNSIRWRSLKGKGGKASDVLDNQLLVCFASGIASGWMYIEWAHRMIEETGLEVILVDPPGNGHSEIRMSGVRSPFDLEGDLEGCSSTEEMMEIYCKDLVVVIREQGWCNRGMHLVGTSFGSLIGAYLALTYPDWVKSLTLFGWLHSIRHTPEVKATHDSLHQRTMFTCNMFQRTHSTAYPRHHDLVAHRTV